MEYKTREALLRNQHNELLARKNYPLDGNGVYERFRYPVVTAEHAPLE